MASDVTLTTLRGGGTSAFASREAVRGMLLAHGPAGAATRDRMPIESRIIIGRSTKAPWAVSDQRLSSRHFAVQALGEEIVVEDLGSTNGTFVDGRRLEGRCGAAPGTVIRAGRCLFVLERDLDRLSVEATPPSEMAGRFYSPWLVSQLDVARATERHLLISGESGTGKELCARWIASRLRSSSRIVAHNCARFASVDEAESTLFGVAKGTFSDVDARPGLIERAEGGVLFLDEVHALPIRVQRSLLRILEDGLHARIGAAEERQADVRFVLATNVAVDSPELAPDLVARLYRVEAPSLSERRADVPELFEHALNRAAEGKAVDLGGLRGALSPDHFEALCLADFRGDNVRALERLAEEIVARASQGWDAPEAAVRRVFGDRLGQSPIAKRTEPHDGASHYELHRERILAAYHAADGNLSKTERALKDAGLSVSRRWLAEFLRRWGVRAVRPRKGRDADDA